MINVLGTLLDPTGNSIADAVIRITSLDTIGQTVVGSEAEYITSDDGSYSFPLAYGTFKIEINYEDEFHLLGSVTVNENTPNPSDIPYLILIGSPEVPPDILVADTNWQLLYDTIVATGSHRDSLDQIKEGTTFSAETKELWLKADAKMTEETTESNSEGSKTVTEKRAYSDINLNQSATHTIENTAKTARAYSSVEAYSASNGKEEVKLIADLTTPTGAIKNTQVVDDTQLESSKEISFGSTSLIETTTGDSTSFLSTTSASAGGSTHVRKNQLEPTYTNELGQAVNHERALQEASLKLIETIGQVLHSAQITDTQEVAVDINDLAKAVRNIGLKVYDKEAYQRLSVENQESVQTTQVDKYIIQDDAGNALAHFDTVGNKLKINGTLEITNAEDFKGDAGDTYDYIYEYSADNGVNDPWESAYEVGDKWRRQRQTLNGTAVGAWSEGFYIFAEDGRDGDTYFNQYQYSVDDASKSRGEWHVDYLDGDDWRRWRVIENGLPVPIGHQFYGPVSGWWEERMKGLDGPAGWVPHLQYQYSVDGLPPWHGDFITGDAWRREKVDWYASNEDFLAKDDPVNPSTPALTGTWTSGAKIAPIDGEDYGDKYATVIMYQRSNSAIPPTDPNPITYNFDTATITPATSNGWSSSIPEGLEDIWIAVGTAHSRTNEDTVGDWVIEKQISGGYKSAIAWLYKATANNVTLTDIDLPTQPLEYDYLTGKVITPTNTSWLKGWSQTIPNIPDEGLLWVTFNTALTPVSEWTDTLDAPDWETPAVMSKGGLNGESGTSGAGWYFITGISATWFITNSVFDWVGKATELKNLFISEFGKAPVPQDIISLSTTDGTKQDTGMYDEALNRFDAVAQLVNGNMIVDGTLKARHLAANAITGDKINSATTIIAGSGTTTAGMNGDDTVGTYSGIRFWSGSATPKEAGFKGFKVLSDGTTEITKGELRLGENRQGEGFAVHDEDGSRFYDDSGILRVRIGKLI